MQPFDFNRGNAPLLLSMPHCGTALPPSSAEAMTGHSLAIADTDWHIDTLYEFATELGVSTIRPHVSRYVIDLNRPPDNAELYPGATSTDLCPTTSFAGEPVYRPGREPDSAEINHRLTNYWQPYHRKLQLELARIKEQHGLAVLFEAHSICSIVPRLFPGRLPDLNIGTATGSSCAASMASVAESILKYQRRYSWVSNERFKGGYITRAYGKPSANIHALQLELAQCTYMEENAPYKYLPEQAKRIQPLLKQLLQSLIRWAVAHAG